jgi:hypothetical protein
MSTQNYTLPTGSQCVHYEAGATDQDPAPAVVYRDHPKGALSILILGPGSNRLKKNCYHKDHPELKRRPDVARTSGCWDYVGGEPPPALVVQSTERLLPPVQSAAVSPPPPPLPPTSSESAEDITKVMSYHRTGKIPQVIASFMGAGWNKDRVTAVIDSQTKNSA